MSNIGRRERETQNSVVQFFQEALRYDYLGNLEDQENSNIREDLLTKWLEGRGVTPALIKRVMHQIGKASALGEGKQLYYANKDFYSLLRYGVKDKEGAGALNETVWLIDWENPEANHFAIAEEVTVRGTHTKRPDIVIYVNGIALGVIELKRSSVSVTEGIRQNLDNQKATFIRNFFTTIQLVMAGNETEGIRYGTIETPEKYYLEWKEEAQEEREATLPILESHLYSLCNKQRFLQIIHDFIVFDAGVKKTCRHNQFFGVEKAKKHIARREGGIIWHTQGSGKSLTMVWLAKWIRENVRDSRVLIITDRTELDQQIQMVFNGVDEEIYRTKSGADLIKTLNKPTPWLICSLVHKFGLQTKRNEDEATEEFITEITQAIPSDFSAKGDLFVFVDECHRTQSGKLHEAMKRILPEAMFIGFTGTPLMKRDKKKSIEVFGPYIHTYKFDEAVADGVVLDLRYEARDIDQSLSSPEKVDKWFEAKTQGLSDLGKKELKKKWGTMQKVLSSRSRLDRIVTDILLDMEEKPRLQTGRGNAMLVCSSVYEACQVYEAFSETELKDKVAIITSFQPNASVIKGEESGEGETENQFKYKTYRQMIANFFEIGEEEAVSRVEDFEKEAKRRFIEEPGQMKLLIVVDKLLTGFDAPPATYLYIDKKMADHNLFQAICRVNRLDGEDKDYGYIVDYKDLFHSLDKAISDYTQGAFDGYDEEDVAGLLKDRLKEGKKDLDEALEMVQGLCEPVRAPRERIDYIHYFCGASGENLVNNEEKEALRLTLYQSVARLVRCYMNIANEMLKAGYSQAQWAEIKAQVAYYQKLRDEIKIASNDYIDTKRYEAGMRQLFNRYIDASMSRPLSDFDGTGLLELIMAKGAQEAIEELPEGIKKEGDAVAETIENNVRRKIVEEMNVNPEYYEKMSEVLDELIELRRQKSLDYQEYLEKIKDLIQDVVKPEESEGNYPISIDTMAKRALYDNFGQNELLVIKINDAVLQTKRESWIGDRFKEREVARAIMEATQGLEIDVDVPAILEIVKAQKEYQ